MRLRTSLLASAFSLILAMTSQALAATATVKDGATLQLANNTFRLDGIDAPAVDQMCIDEHADSWACGGDMRATIRALIVANNYLEDEVTELMKAVSHAYTRGRFQTYSG